MECADWLQFGIYLVILLPWNVYFLPIKLFLPPHTLGSFHLVNGCGVPWVCDLLPFFFFGNRKAKGICKYKIIFMPELWNDFFLLLSIFFFFLLLFSSVLFADICRHAVIGKMLSEHIWSKSNCRFYAVYIMMVSWKSQLSHSHSTQVSLPAWSPYLSFSRLGYWSLSGMKRILSTQKQIVISLGISFNESVLVILGINLICRMLNQWWIWLSFNKVVFVCFTETMPGRQIFSSFGFIRWVSWTIHVSLNNHGEECWSIWEKFWWKFRKKKVKCMWQNVKAFMI